MQVSRTGQAAGAGGRPTRAAAPDEARELLHVVGRELEERGLVVADGHDHDGRLSHVDATNPDAPERGTVSIGWDGYLIWERWGPAEGAAEADAIVNIVTSALAIDADPAPPVRDSAGPK